MDFVEAFCIRRVLCRFLMKELRGLCRFSVLGGYYVGLGFGERVGRQQNELQMVLKRNY